MEPRRESRATMTDLLERVIDKGVMVKLDLVVGLAGIPLIGISLQAAVASIETMLEYGMMEAWDSRQRSVAGREGEWRDRVLRPGEEAQLELYGSYRETEGVRQLWRPGRLLLTDERLLLVRPLPYEVLFAVPLSSIAGLGRVQRADAAGGRGDIACLALEDGKLAAIHTAETDALEACLRERLRRLGRTVTELGSADLGTLGFAAAAAGQLWHHWPAADGQASWKSGWAVLTADELTWRADVGSRVEVRVPLEKISRLAVEHRRLAGLGTRDVLVVVYPARGHTVEALFTGDDVGDWPTAIRQAGYPVNGDDHA